MDDMKIMEFIIIPILGIFMLLHGSIQFLESTLWFDKYIFSGGFFFMGCVFLGFDLIMIYHRIKNIVVR